MNILKALGVHYLPELASPTGAPEMFVAKADSGLFEDQRFGPEQLSRFGICEQGRGCIFRVLALTIYAPLHNRPNDGIYILPGCSEKMSPGRQIFQQVSLF